MNPTGLILAVLLVLGAALYARQASRRLAADPGQGPLSLQVTRIAANVVMAGCTACVFFILAVPAASVMIGAVVNMLGLAFVASNSAKYLSKLPLAKDAPTARALFGRVFDEVRHRLFLWLRAVWGALAPCGWGEVTLTSKAVDKIPWIVMLPWKRPTLAAIVCLILMIAPAVVQRATGLSGIVMSAVAGYSALIGLSILTVGVGAVVLVALVLGESGVLSFSIALTGSAKKLAASIGYGTVIGAVAAALAPIYVFLSPDSWDISKTATPSLLVEYPAIGAVFGYLWGLVGVVQNLGSRASNLVYRHLLFPGLFAAVFWTITQFLTPEFVFDRITNQASASAGVTDLLCNAAENDPILQSHRTDHVWFLLLLKHCGSAYLISSEFLAHAVLWPTGLVALHGLWTGIQRRVPSTNRKVPVP